jgi:Cof subfamily protein (haloacid dehalogenase superfamily)
MLNKRLRDLLVIVFDLDGTLLDDNGEIGEETLKLVPKLRNEGVQFSIASGRLHSAVVDFAEQLGINIPVISLDGSLIRGLNDGESVFESFVKEEYVEKAVSYADKFLINIALCAADAIYFDERTPAIPQILDKYGARYREVPSLYEYCDKTLEVVFAGDNKNSMNFVFNRLRFPYAFGLNASMYKSQRKSGLYYLEIRKKGSTKGKGLLRLLKNIKVKVRNSAVIGDWYNDLSLFKTPALKVAVANAVPELRRKADIVTARTNNEDGTAEFLEMVLKAKKGK